MVTIPACLLIVLSILAVVGCAAVIFVGWVVIVVLKEF